MRKFYPQDKIEGLCTNCNSGIVMEGSSGRIRVHCTWMDKAVPEPLVRCSKYSNKNDIHVDYLESIATLLIQNKMGKIGFIRPGTEEHKQWRKGGGVDPSDIPTF